MPKEIDSIVHAARALTDPTSRGRFLDEACRGDEAVRARVEAILQSDQPTVDHAPAPLSSDETVAASEAGVRAPLSEGPGTMLGPYRLLERIGQGGFGTVFLAEQQEPIVRRVAVKLLKPGMDTERVVARFEAERQALAMMDHPNIARVVDAGATPSGRPFFVMDLVVGAPISTYCDENALPVAARLGLFAQVCNAVQHAHTKGIIHRDIKPSNVLVSTHDGKPHAKVIDFGIAKATAVRPEGKTLFTVDGAMIGTPEYMSPEQAEGSLDVDARTDVYSLGVLLYELLTGSTPFSTRELKSAGLAEIRRIIREVDPPKPSTRIGHSADTAAATAARRQTAPKRLSAIVRGELDWIVMRALEKDRQRRYPTANALAMDVQRFLSGEPVVAAPPGAAYRAGKFVKRHRAAVVGAATVAVALVAGAVAVAWQATIARGQRDRAVSAEARARRTADELRKVSDFQAAMLAQVDPASAGRSLEKEVVGQFERTLAEADLSERERAAQRAAFSGQWGRVNATDAARIGTDGPREARRRGEGPPRGLPSPRVDPWRGAQGDARVRESARRALPGPAGFEAGAWPRSNGLFLGREAPPDGPHPVGSRTLGLDRPVPRVVLAAGRYDAVVSAALTPPPAWGPGPLPPPAPGGTVSVRPLPDGEEIVLRATGWLRLVPAAFLLFWLCGWAVGELLVLLILLGPLADPLVSALREVLPGAWPRPPRFAGSTPWPAVAFLAVWFVFWTWGGLTAAWQLLRLVAGSDRFVTRPGGFSLRPGAGPFGRTRDFPASEVSAVYADVRRSRLVAVVRGSERLLCSGTPPPVAEWLAARLRAALGLPGPTLADSGERDAEASAEPPVPVDWEARPLPEGGVLLSAPPARSRKTAGCALAVAVVVTAGFVAVLLAAGVRRESPGAALVFGLLILAVDVLCSWLAFARESWLLRPGLIARVRSLGPWERRREVRHGSLAVSVSTDSDDDDWFRLEARGEGRPLKLSSRINAGPEVLAFARYAARHSGFPLDVPHEVLLAAGAPRNGSSRARGPA